MRLTKQQMAKIRVLIKEVCDRTGYTVEEYTTYLKARAKIDSFGALTIDEASRIITEIELDRVFLK